MTGKRSIRRIFFAFLALAVSIAPLLSSCASKMTDEEARAILTELVPKSQKLNVIFWGEGLPITEDAAPAVESVSGAQYREVSERSEFQSIAEIKAYAETVFSSDYLTTVYASAFGEYDAEDIEMPKETLAENNYAVSFDARYTEKDGVLFADMTYKSYELGTEIFPETAVVKKSGVGVVVCLVDCTVGGEKTTMNVTLCQQGEKWLLDSPTY